MKRIFALAVFLAILACGAFVYWAQQPITVTGEPAVEFTVQAGSSVRASAQQIADAGVPLNPTLFAWLARLTGKASKLKAGTYSLKGGTTPLSLVGILVRGEFAQEAIIIIEGWTFAQMRHAIDTHPALKHETAKLSDRELLAKITQDYQTAEGLFFPDTYLFAPGASDLQIYKQANLQMMKHLTDDWARHDSDLPVKSPYEALILASIVEKETGQKSERPMVAGVFVNRLRRGMMLQTDPTVIYGMGDKYQGQIHKKDLQTDTPYNTYTRTGLPPTPISLPGAASLDAAMNP
ncbi:MAG: endolytic transglycosylase MltG, partial [Burkholderiaceae bacterium]|nr:endolytic transglycosylase MltG [Burkholderiaceae bacterium]